MATKRAAALEDMGGNTTPYVTLRRLQTSTGVKERDSQQARVLEVSFKLASL